MIHQSFNKDQSQSLPDASVEHQHVLVRVVPPVASPEGCSVLATNVTTWPSVLLGARWRIISLMRRKVLVKNPERLHFGWMIMYRDFIQFHHHFPTLFKSRKNQVKKKNIQYQYLMSRVHVELHTIQIHPLYTAVDTKIRLR